MPRTGPDPPNTRTKSIPASRKALRRSPAPGLGKPLPTSREETVPAPLNLPSTGEQVGPRFDSDPRRRHSRDHHTPAAHLPVSDPVGVLTGGRQFAPQRP